MRHTPIRVLKAAGTPEEVGRAHGSTFASEIRHYATDRIALSAQGTDWDRSRIIDLAQRMLPAHERYDSDLYDEMVAMAAAAHLSPAEAVIVGGYTDFIDTVRSVAGGGSFEDSCTAVLVPDSLANGAGMLAQTWDMHASATPHIIMLDVTVGSGPRALAFTTVGTLGQIGLNEAGIAVGINNLTADDGRIGITWPFVVRQALKQHTLDGAVAAVLEAPLAGGHNFLLMAADGRGVSIEAMPSATHVSELEATPLAHTNHCLNPNTMAVEGARPPELQQSSVSRLSHVPEVLADRPITIDHLMQLTRDERSICRHPEPPFDYESCGAAIMRPATREMWACWGVPSENDYEPFGFR